MREQRSRVPLNPERGTRIVPAFLFFLLICVSLRLVWLQVVSASRLSSQAASSQPNVITLSAKRGTIYDRNGSIIAMSIDCTTIYCNPQEIEDAEEVAKILADHLDGDRDYYLSLLEQDTTFSYLYRQADADAADLVKEDLAAAELKGVYYLTDSKRYYPYGAVGNQVLGRVNVDGDGVSGLEYYYDDILGGTDGEMIMEVGADGTPVAGGVSEITEAVNGSDIVISLDMDIQAAAEQTIVEAVSTYGAESGSVVVTNPQTGEILAICSTPLADFSDASTITDESLQLKPISSSYEPGSIFKPITLAIGIEYGCFNPSTTYTVPPEVQVGDDMVADDDLRDYTMDMTVREIIRRSSNTGAVLMSNSIGRDNFAQGVANFGIGSITGIDYPGEAVGLVTSRENYTGATMGAMSFGQGVSVPVIQMVSAIGTIANDGVCVTPHFLISQDGEELDWGEGVRVISSETSATVTDVLRSVVEEGTGTAGQVEGFDIAGKTGTAEMADQNSGGYLEETFLASMIGYAQASDPEVLVYVGLNGTSLLAADSAAAVFSTIMSEALSVLGVSYES